MSPLPHHQPKQLSLGSLEAEIIQILWRVTAATAQEIHQQILADPERELACSSVMTVLHRLEKKGWLSCDRSERAYVWRPLVSQHEVQVLKTHKYLQKFLASGNPDIVAAFADSLDSTSIEKLEAMAQRLKAAKEQGDSCT
ncbi:MAG: BlaI/MecI/CopY family transcriptional regulator [Cyanobacteria bacterium P01_A01_bin.135]